MALIVPFRRLASEFERAAKNSTWRALGNLVDRNFAEIERASRPHAARAYRTAAKSLAAATAMTAVEVDTASFDDEGLFNLVTGEYRAPEDGDYHVNGAVTINLNNNPEGVEIVVHVNGAVRSSGSRIWVRGGVGGDFWGMAVSDIIRVSAGDLIDLRAYHDAGGNPIALVVGNPHLNYLSVHKA